MQKDQPRLAGESSYTRSFENALQHIRRREAIFGQLARSGRVGRVVGIDHFEAVHCLLDCRERVGSFTEPPFRLRSTIGLSSLHQQHAVEQCGLIRRRSDIDVIGHRANGVGDGEDVGVTAGNVAGTLQGVGPADAALPCDAEVIALFTNGGDAEERRAVRRVRACHLLFPIGLAIAVVVLHSVSRIKRV